MFTYWVVTLSHGSTVYTIYRAIYSAYPFASSKPLYPRNPRNPLTQQNVQAFQALTIEPLHL